MTKKKFMSLIAFMAAALALALTSASCGTNDDNTDTVKTAPTTSTTSTAVAPSGIVLDPNLTSKTGIPGPEDMKALIGLQAELPYDVIVPTALPAGNYILVKELVGSGAPSEKDPTGYYSFRFADNDQPDHVLTFNQSRANSTPLSAYYLTNVTINDIPYQVYWHRSRDYLPQGEPVVTDTVGDAEAFVVIWKGQYTDAAGKPQELYYSLTTGTWAYDWNEVQAILQSLKPLKDVGQ